MLKSTHPTGDATEELLKNVANAKAKIHASHGECDRSNAVFLTKEVC